MKKIVLVAILSAQAINSIDDNFFKNKLSQRLIKLLEAYLNFKKDNVAQYNKCLIFTAELNCLLEDIDYVIHACSGADSPLLNLKLKALDLKLDFIKILKLFHLNMIKGRQAAEASPAQFPDRLTNNQEKIVEFIKKSKKIRAKDIVEKFTSLSERTIKRTLKDLTEFGILKREEADRAVYYSFSS